jgi:glycosyltransferase involved in cell wall biosynthesis
MRCPTLKELPPPPPGKTGWPWTEETPQLPERMRDGSPWPRITIVTPSFNQGGFIEETMRSVFLQGYPDLEYIIVDGGSQDQSIDVIKEYEKWLPHWESKPDSGQAHAINKGFRKGSGEVIAWINSDDFYLPGTFSKVACWLNHEAGIFLVYGDCQVVDANGRGVDRYRGKFYSDQDFRAYWNHYVPQPSAFFLRSILDEVGYLDETLNFVMDYDFWVRCSQRYLLYYSGEILAAFRLHGASKSVAFKKHFDPELDKAVRKYWGNPLSPTHLRYLLKRNRYRSGVLRWHAYEALQSGQLRKCARLISRALLQDPLFFLNKKFLNPDSFRNRYLPFLHNLLVHVMQGRFPPPSHLKRSSKT